MLLVVQESWAARLRVAGDGVPARTVERHADGSLTAELREGKRAFALLESADGSLRSPLIDCGVAGRSDRIELRVAPSLVREVVLSLPREVLAVQGWVALAASRHAGELCRLSAAPCRERGALWAAPVRLLAEAPSWVCLEGPGGELWLELPSFRAEVGVLPLVLPPLESLRVRDDQGRPVTGALVECIMAPDPRGGSIAMPFFLGRTDVEGRLRCPAHLVGLRTAVVIAPGYSPWSGVLVPDIELRSDPQRPWPAPPFDRDHTFFFRFHCEQHRDRLSSSASVFVDDGALVPSETGEVTAWSTSGQSARTVGSEWRQLEPMALHLGEPDGRQGGHFAMGAPGWPGGLTVRSDGQTDFTNAAPSSRPLSLHMSANARMSAGTRTIPACARGPIVWLRSGQVLRSHDRGAMNEPFADAPAERVTLTAQVADATGLHLHCEVVADDRSAYEIDDRGFVLWRRFFAAFVNRSALQIPVPAGMSLRVRSVGHYVTLGRDEPLAGGQEHELVPRTTGILLVYSSTQVRMAGADRHRISRLHTLNAFLIAEVPYGDHEVHNAAGAKRVHVEGDLQVLTMDE